MASYAPSSYPSFHVAPSPYGPPPPGYPSPATGAGPAGHPAPPPPNAYPANSSFTTTPSFHAPTPSPSFETVPMMGSVAVVDTSYCSPQQVTLIVSENVVSLSGDDFTVRDQTGRLWFRMDSRAFSMSQRRVLVDASDRPVLSMARKLMSMRKKWYMYRGASTSDAARVATIEPKILTLRPSVNVYLNDGDKIPDFKIRGDFLARSFDVYKLGSGGCGEQLVATVRKESRFQSISSYIKQSSYNKQTYYVTLQPGVDAAFVVALCVAVDEHYRDDV